MARRKRTTLDDLGDFFVAVPWWIGPIVAGAGFAVFRYLLPLLMPRPTSDNPATAIMTKTISQVLGPLPAMLAPWVAGVILLVWLGSLLAKLTRRNILESTRDMDSLRALPWREFELLVGEYYRRRGFLVEERGGASADGGVDIALRKSGRMTLVQCKHWKVYKVGVQPVRELLGVMSHGKADEGVFVTSGTYTSEARDFARQNRIDLVDGDSLLQMVGSVRQTHGSPSGQVTQPAPSPRPSITGSAPACPKCGSPMALRTARTGQNAGSQFYGCTRYPACRGIRNLGA